MGMRPNYLRESEIDELEDWELLVCACHYGPNMGDCVAGDYEYTFDGETVYLVEKITVENSIPLDDIDVSNPMAALQYYAGVGDWRELAKQKLRDTLKEEEE